MLIAFALDVIVFVHDVTTRTTGCLIVMGPASAQTWLRAVRGRVRDRRTTEWMDEHRTRQMTRDWLAMLVADCLVSGMGGTWLPVSW